MSTYALHYLPFQYFRITYMCNICNIIYHCSTLYKAYRESLNLREKNKDGWIKQAYNLLNLLNVDITAMDRPYHLSKTISECTPNFKQSFHAFCDERKGNSNITALRLSAHKLNIEQLCYTSIQATIPPEQRLCSLFNLKETEDEFIS